MTKAELVKALQDATGLSGVQAGQSLNWLGDIMAAELIGGGEVPLPGIGKLKIKETKARSGRNPKTGETIQIAAGRKAVLVVSKELKDSLK